MTDDDRTSVVEFVGGDVGTGTDEALPGPNRRSPSQRLQLAVGAAVLIGVAVAARAITHDGTDKNAVTHDPPPPRHVAVARSTTPVAPATPPPTRATPPAAGRMAQVYGERGPGSCPPEDNGMPTCTGLDRVPRAVLTALRERFPDARHVVALDEQLRDIGFGPGGLWYREVDARQGVRTIVVAVHRQVDAELPTIARFREGTRTTLVVTSTLRKYAVRIQVSAPNDRRTSPVPIDVLLHLALDRRLLASA